MGSWLNLVARSDKNDSHVTSRVDVRAFSFLVLASVNGEERGNGCALFVNPYFFRCFDCSAHGGHTC